MGVPEDRDEQSAGQVVVIGVGQLRNNREKEPARALEPLELIRSAVAGAADDAGIAVSALSAVDAVGVVQVVSWSYDDLAGSVAAAIGAPGAATHVSEAGGHQPVAVLTRLAGAIAAGESELAVVCGGEAQSSLELLGAAKEPARAEGWSHSPGGPGGFSRATGGTERMWDLGLVGPTRIYPLWENRLRHDLGQSFAESQAWSASMYAGFSEVAAANEAAWNREPVSADQVSGTGPKNRMICFPYPLRMNALNRVDQGAALILASPAAADRLGVAPQQRVYLHAAALDEDCEDVLERDSYGGSAGLGRSLDAALEQAGTTADELDVVDLYSCFPVVPKLGALHLGLDRDAALSATGGLTSFGGAHNNYSAHALVAVVRRLRGSGGTGLVYANGEYLTKHASVVLGQEPAPEGFRWSSAAAPEHGPVTVDDAYVGPLEIETYTVEFDREGEPARGYVIGRSPRGDRVGVRVSRSDTSTLEALVDPGGDPVGRTGSVVAENDRRLFTLARG
ncbi:acetyl-CoA acetyltransferase [Pseudonocardia sp. KRD291]|uniref:acetyl-CoA acetyltransferase n=1 Tax=Pseudonocardia sp. KRD291 TaxID=2792007 RepID=UPI001C49CC6D|nr:acetyl-CoA acetyltransferase [Pseudonocardia sp. KRD291]MBW0101216.1 acetyl-CoA acetyltransferase [Pseudonocardia sp. KRD291]